MPPLTYPIGCVVHAYAMSYNGGMNALILFATVALELLMPQAQRVTIGTGTVEAVAVPTVVVGAVPDAPAWTADEAYSIDLTPTGVTITASTERGVRYARVTLEQLKRLSGKAPLPVVRIVDWPVLKERGVKIEGEGAENAEEFAVFLDVMAAAKMNLLVWPQAATRTALVSAAAARGIAVRAEAEADEFVAGFAFDVLSHVAFAGPVSVPSRSCRAAVVRMRMNDVGDLRPAIVGFAERFWTGGGESRPEFVGRLPSPGTPAFSMAAAIERRLIAQRDRNFIGQKGGFPFIGQTRMRWRVRNGETGKVVAMDIPQGTVWACDERTKANALVSDACETVLFETWVKSSDDRTVGCLHDLIPTTGEVSVNGVPVAMPRGKGVASVRFRKGWNYVLARVVREGPCVRTGVTFCPIDGTRTHPREVADFTYAATPPLHAFVQLWGDNLVRGPNPARRFRDIPVASGHFYHVRTTPCVGWTCRFRNAQGHLVGEVQNSGRQTSSVAVGTAERDAFYPPISATSAELLLDAEAHAWFYEDPEPPKTPVPDPNRVAYDDRPVDAPSDRFQREIDAAAARGGGIVRVPSGIWHVKPIVLRSNVTIDLAEGAVLLASVNPNDYDPSPRRRAFVYAENATNVVIRGKGTLDGRGYAFRETGANMSGESQPQTLPKLLCFNRCRNVTLEDFTYRRGGAWGCHLCNSDGVVMRRVTCFNHVNATNDGIDIESANVLIEDCDIDADDDAIAVKSESDPGFAVTNVVIRRCRLASMAYPFKIGTGSYGDVRGIRVEDCTFPRTKMNHRFPWSKLSAGITNDVSGICGIGIQCTDGGHLSDVTVRNVAVEGYATPLAIRLGRRHAPPHRRETFLRNVLIENVSAIAEGPTASSICGSRGLEVENVTLRNVCFTLAGGAQAADVAAFCPNEKGYPGPKMFGSILPAAGLYVKDAQGIVLENVDFKLLKPDVRPLTVGL